MAGVCVFTAGCFFPPSAKTAAMPSTATIAAAPSRFALPEGAGVAWLFVQLCDVAAETGRILGERTLRLEGQVGAWLCPLLLLLPPAHGVVFSLVFYANAGLPPLLDIARLVLLWPEWIRVAMLLAPLIALAVSMEARLRCIAALRLLKREPHCTLP